MKTTLTDLAPELIERICAEVAFQYNATPEDIKDNLRHLRLVCRQLKYPPEIYLFRDVTLDARKKRRLSFVPEAQVQDHIDDNGSIFRFCKVLRIKFGCNSKKEWTATQIKMPGMSDAFLVPVLSAFQQVRSVEWHVESADPSPQIITALRSLPLLKTLLLHFIGIPFHDFPLPTLSSLHKLSISNIRDGRYVQEILTQVSFMLVSNPYLTHLSLDFSSNTDRSIRFPFPSFPKPTPENPFPCKLEYLRFRGCGFKFRGRPQLGCLTYLDIDHTTFPSNTNIWAILGDTVKLRTIIVDSIPATLATYLQSYSGLEKLILRAPKKRHWGEAQGGCDREMFYKKVLPLHKESIVALALYNLSPVYWSTVDEYTSVLLECKNLEALSVDVSLEHIGGHVRNLPEMLTNLLTFPLLRSVGLYWTSDLRFTGDHQLYVWGIERNIMEFELPHDRDIFRISTIRNFFEPTLLEGRHRWGATPVKPVSGIAIDLGWVL
ncbi:hypothetical protein CC2G_008567 [Coprinopsis cinerea AmutBmut pab1-1]|nr:hypothetical protein CC2G_008567 [Coprinopsis cinerea AmutBmut pab1-1]